MNKLVIRMKRVRETKNTYRYEAVLEPGQSPTVDCIYLPKYLIAGTPPVELVVTVEEAK